MNQTKAGRRTPLSLGPTKSTSTPRKISTDSADKSGDSSSRSSTPASAASSSGGPSNSNVDQLKAKVQNDATNKAKQSKTTTNANENGSKNGTAGQKNGNGLNEEKTTKGGSSQNKSMKQTASPLKGGSNNDAKVPKTPSTTSTTSPSSSSSSAAAAVIDIESKTKKSPADKLRNKVSVKESPTSTKEISVEMITPELTPTKETPKKGSKTNSPAIGTPTSAPPPPPAVVIPDDDMDCVLIESPPPPLYPERNMADSPMPSAKGTKTLRLKQGGPPPVRGRISPLLLADDKLQNASTTVNLSTVSEQSTESGVPPITPSIILTESDTPDNRPYGLSLRSISGRRSTRPINSNPIQYTNRETYRRIPNDFNDSLASLNATVGSEIANDSFRSPALGIFSRFGRKRPAASDDDDDDDDDADNNVDAVVESSEQLNNVSPKKRRIDFGGFFGVLASPVTMLRAKFRRTHINSSTPNVTSTNNDDDDAIDGDLVDVSLQSESNDNDNLNESNIDNEIDLVQNISTEKHTNVDTKMESNGNDLVEDEEGVSNAEEAIEVREVKRNRCNVM